MNRDRAFLRSAAQRLSAALGPKFSGNPWRIKNIAAADVYSTNTDGWTVQISRGRGPSLEIWLDRFSGLPDRKLYVGFRVKRDDQYHKKLKTFEYCRKVDAGRGIDKSKKDHWHLLEALKAAEFHQPILELYADKVYFGLFERAKGSASAMSAAFENLATSFVQETAELLRVADVDARAFDQYPAIPNRKKVASHLIRERSALLAMGRKLKDGFVCQACGLRLRDVYSPILGRDYAEAHHIVPLHKLSGKAKTTIDDLRTVCANCHRVLHQMNGEATDFATLKKVMNKRHSKSGLPT